MKISKHIHSCLLVEDKGKTILLDPGNYSYDEKALDINSLTKLDAVGITHEHMDHMHIPFIMEIVAKFPTAQFFSNNSVKEILGKEGISVDMSGNDFLQMHLAPHEKIWMSTTPTENVMIALFNKFATVGDSLTFDKSPEILALPIQAPWGSTTWAVETALKVRPKIIIPIHDWHWKDQVRISMYERLEQYFAQVGIRFIKAETGKVFEF